MLQYEQVHTKQLPLANTPSYPCQVCKVFNSCDHSYNNFDFSKQIASKGILSFSKNKNHSPYHCREKYRCAQETRQGSTYLLISKV